MYYRGSAAAIVVYDITNQVRLVSLIFLFFFVFKVGVQSGCCIIQYTSTRVCLVRKVHGRSIFYCCCNSVEKLYRNAELDPGVEAAGTSQSRSSNCR